MIPVIFYNFSLNTMQAQHGAPGLLEMALTVSTNGRVDLIKHYDGVPRLAWGTVFDAYNLGWDFEVPPVHLFSLRQGTDAGALVALLRDQATAALIMALVNRVDFETNAEAFAKTLQVLPTHAQEFEQVNWLEHAATIPNPHKETYE